MLFCRAGLVALACTGGATAAGAGKGTAVSSSSCRRLCARCGGLTHTTQLLLELVTDEALELWGPEWFGAGIPGTSWGPAVLPLQQMNVVNELFEVWQLVQQRSEHEILGGGKL